MKLLLLELENFKGCKWLKVEPNGDNLSIYGDNETGKTTLFDAYLWLLFGKDSLGQSDFDIKTLINGQPVHNLNHRVRAKWDMGKGETMELEAIYREKWVKARGKAKAEFEGHTTDYRVQGVPVKESEFRAHIKRIIDERQFRLLSDVRYFNATLKWQERREMLLQLIGDITQADIINGREDLAELARILGNRSVDDHRKVLKSSRTATADELEKIPVRIDTLNKLIAESESVTRDPSPVTRQELEAKVSTLRDERSRLNAGGEAAEKTAQLRTAEADLQTLLGTLRSEANTGHDEQLKVVRDLERVWGDVAATVQSLERNREFVRQAITTKESELDALRAEWRAENDRKFTPPEIDTECAACGQSLPVERVAAARIKAEENFNQGKAQILEINMSKGKLKSQELTQIKASIEEIEAEINVAINRRTELQVQVTEAKAKLTSTPAPSVQTEDPRVAAANARIATLQSELEQVKQSIEPRLREVHEEIHGLTAQIDAINAAEARANQSEQAKKQIEGLEADEKRLAGEIERMDHELFLCEEFIRAKVSLLEERVNDRFELVRFRLFEEQVNGGLQEVCEATVDGVPYSSMNNAKRINAGLDIINTLSAHHGFAPPIFVDNAEAVTRLLPTSAQRIRLVVSEPDKALRVVPEPALELVAPAS